MVLLGPAVLRWYYTKWHAPTAFTVRVVPQRRFLTPQREEIAHIYQIQFVEGHCPLEKRITVTDPINYIAAQEGAISLAMSASSIKTDEERICSLVALLRRRFNMNVESAMATAKEAIRQENAVRDRLVPRYPVPLIVKVFRACIGPLVCVWGWVMKAKWTKLIPSITLLAPYIVIAATALGGAGLALLQRMGHNWQELHFAIPIHYQHALQTLIMRCATGIYGGLHILSPTFLKALTQFWQSVSPNCDTNMICIY